MGDDEDRRAYRMPPAAKVVGRSKPGQGSYVVAATGCPGQIDALYENSCIGSGLLS